ncbi:MAG: hypothetical protein O2794_01720 [bacterium]|nr:hypothetical protein [bacterium]
MSARAKRRIVSILFLASIPLTWLLVNWLVKTYIKPNVKEPVRVAQLLKSEESILDFLNREIESVNRALKDLEMFSESEVYQRLVLNILVRESYDRAVERTQQIKPIEIDECSALDINLRCLVDRSCSHSLCSAK